jgi:hypothetical protein
MAILLMGEGMVTDDLGQRLERFPLVPSSGGEFIDPVAIE